MKIPPVFERWSWVAGIAAAVISLVAYLWPMSPADQKTPIGPPPSTTSIIQSAGPNSTQIGAVTGNVVVNNRASSPPDLGPVDIEGNWDKKKAAQIALAKLRNANWSKIDSQMAKPIVHREVGQYSLVYKTREGMVVAYATKTKDAQCHACAPHLSFFEFEKRLKGWKMVGSEIAVWKDGAWGEPPTMSVRVIADDRFGVFFESGYTAQGWTVSGTVIYVRMGDSYRRVLHLISSQISPEGVKWDTTMTMRPTSTGLYDIEVVRTGAHGPKDLVWLDGREELKEDVANPDETIRPKDTFKFDGQVYRRSEMAR